METADGHIANVVNRARSAEAQQRGKAGGGVVTPAELRTVAENLRRADELIDECNSQHLFGDSWLMGFDLEYLAGHFDDAADRLESTTKGEAS